MPKAERVINDYLTAIGGKKRVAKIKDTVYEWKLTSASRENSSVYTRARTRVKSPAGWRFDMQISENTDSGTNLDAGAITTATNGSSVWKRDAAGKLQTLTDAEANSIRLQAMLAATHFTNLQNQRISIQTVGTEKIENELVNVVEFSMRNGARARYFFGVNNKLLLKIENPVLKTSTCFADYRNTGGVLVPHKLIEACNETAQASQFFELERAAHNTNLNLIAFDPPRSLENFDLQAFLKDLTRNQAEIDRRLSEYTYLETKTEREYNDKGEIEKETVRVYEVYPVARNRRVSKLIRENGTALSPERAQKEANRAVKEIQDIESEIEKRQAKAAERQAQTAGKTKTEAESPERGTGISFFLRASEVVAPRMEEFRGRETIVFDFRPREDYKPQNSQEKIFAKLVGTAWIDPEEKKIIRMEMRFPESFKAFGGMAKLKSGSAFVFEQTRLEDGVWLPKFSQVNAGVKAFFVAGFNFNVTSEYSDYKRSGSEIKDYKVNSPNQREEKP
ncbi:MAG TPA: hypothetical protein VEX64_01990 [Pyrinomonadaceae bacterium]|nr:hypothetical protein [Pyrinomonadaceae bacterium]